MPDTAVATPSEDQDFAQQAKALSDANDTRQAATQSAWDAERAPVADAVKKGTDTLAGMASTPAKQVPLPENTARHLDPKQLSETASVFMTLGALGGLLSRRPMTAALNNMTAAMEGVRSGDMEQYDKAYKDFSANYDKAMKTNKAMLDEKEKALKDTNMSLTARMNELRMIDLKYGNEVGKNTRDFNSQMKLWDAQQKAAQHATDKRQQLDQFHESLMARQQQHEDMMALKRDAASGGAGGAGGIDPKTVDFYAQQSISGDNTWQVGLARGKVGQALISAVKDRIPKMAEEFGLSPQDVGTNKAMNVALTKTLADRQKYVTSVEQLSGTLTKQADLVETLIKKGEGGAGSPVLNKWIQAGRQATGDPDVDALNAAITGLAREHQRVLTSPLSNAQLHASAQQTADSLINVAKTPEQMRATIGVMRKEVANAKLQAEETLTETRDKLRSLGKKPEASYATEAEAESAAASGKLKPGDRITIGGKTGTWH